MFLWNIIRDFFVHYIFGGVDSLGEYTYGLIFGQTLVENEGYFFGGDPISTNDFIILIPHAHDYFSGEYGDVYLPISDYLSTTATIIVLVVLAVVVALGIRWLFRFMISRFTKWGL